MTSDGRLAARQPINATAEELAAHGISYQSDDLFTGSAALSGPEIHFGLVRLTARTLPFWRSYRVSAGKVADLLAGLAKKLERSDDRLDRDALAEEFGWSLDRLDHVADLVRGRSYGARRIFRSVKGGVTGIEWLLDEEFAPTEDRFVAYASSQVVSDVVASSDPAVGATPAEVIGRHEEMYSPFLETVGVASEEGLPTVTHFGIFRNPMAFLDDDPTHRGLAMQLHGFAATVAMSAWSNKFFMTTNPMPRMQEIFLRELPPEDVYVADCDDGLRDYINQNLPSGVEAIKQRRRFSFAGFTSGSSPIAVKLPALARFYEPGR